MKIICVGLNYRRHIEELNWKEPSEPVIFLKPDSAILKNNKPFFIPDFSNDLHYEAEVVLRISKLGKGISSKFAHRYYDALTIGIDFTARDMQQKLAAAGLPWELSKTFDGSAPLGKFIPVEKFPDHGKIDFRLEINDELRQQGNTSDMIFSFGAIIEFVSKFYTLKTGDLIFTGTPPGVGPVNKGDNLVAWLGDEKVLDFFVR
ncbi:MAG TPA: fumarylacetoacetate hydrolase family protein [Bacteroidales bacterium]|nr:fumarylacetoacetate hydrolase family protein [Bacteroidales bacterium]HPT11434.1 fumarylacetoacetate hydrolase family protein [Bacteroidales bacterium]